MLLSAVLAFVASHFVLSHPLRAPLIALLGRGAFEFWYSIIAAVELLLIAITYHQADHIPTLWSSDNWVLQFVIDAISYGAIALFIGSLADNPGMVWADLVGLSTRPPTGAFVISRHPMMFAIAIWAAAQILLVPSMRNVIVCTGLIVLALIGAALQDRRKLAASPREWGMWVSRTRFWPRLDRLNRLGPAWGFAIPLWLLSTWVQVRWTFAVSGVWYFFPNLPY